LGPTYKEIEAEQQKEKINKYWNKYKGKTENAMMKSLAKAYYKEFGLALLYNLVRCLMLIVQPILITLILEYIEQPKGEGKGFGYGISLVLVYVFVDLVQNFAWQQMIFLQNLLGMKANHGLV
jgi:hypothetical protein